MTISYQFYADSALTIPISSQGFVQAADGSISPDQRHVYFGSTLTGHTLKAASNPGTDPINLSIVDASTGSGEPATNVKLATTSGGLAGATGGAALSLGTTITSGVANAKSVWIQFIDTTAVVGTYTDISLTTVNVVET